MQRYLIPQPAGVILTMLADALDLVDYGIVLLNRDLRACFINRRFVEIWAVPPELLASGPSFRDLLNHGAADGWYTVPAADLPAYIDAREQAVRAGSIAPSLIDLSDRRQLLFRCVECADGGRILTYADISSELLREASDAAARTAAERRFNSQMLAEQASHLAALAEAAEENAQKAERACQLLEHEIAERRQLETNLRWLATTDGLTGALNRAEILASAQREITAQHGTGQKLIVLMIDVDHFKTINDRFGHAGGDRALQRLVTDLRIGIPPTGLLGRLGGEEFAVVLPDTPRAEAEAIAERLRARVAELQIVCGERLISMTISVGLAVQLEIDRSIEPILARADDALYRAKAGGRNRVVGDHRTEAA